MAAMRRGPPRAAADRVKTDRKDAELLVRLLAGSLSVVAVPPARFEAARDLARAGEQVRADLAGLRDGVSTLRFAMGAVTTAARGRRRTGDGLARSGSSTSSSCISSSATSAASNDPANSQPGSGSSPRCTSRASYYGPPLQATPAPRQAQAGDAEAPWGNQ